MLDRTPSRRRRSDSYPWPALTFALLSIATIAVGRPEATGQTGVPSQGAGGPTSTAAGNTAPAAPASETLRRAVRGRFLIGAAVASRRLGDPGLAALVAQQFDCLTAENEFKPRFLQPWPGRFNFAAADRVVDFARRHGMEVVGHTLCWHSQSPTWMFRGPDGGPLPRDEALRNLRDHIDAVVGHFKGEVVGWDVVNEAISDAPGGYLRDTPALRAIGDDYLVKAFEFAHAADPDAELYYNDYGYPSVGQRRNRLLVPACFRIETMSLAKRLELGQVRGSSTPTTCSSHQTVVAARFERSCSAAVAPLSTNPSRAIRQVEPPGHRIAPGGEPIAKGPRGQRRSLRPTDFTRGPGTGPSLGRIGSARAGGPSARRA